MAKEKSSKDRSSKSRVEIDTEVPIEVDITFDGGISEIPENQPEDNHDQLI